MDGFPFTYIYISAGTKSVKLKLANSVATRNQWKSWCTGI